MKNRKWLWACFPRHGGRSPPAAGRKACRERSRSLPMFVPTTNFQPQASSSGFRESGGPAVPGSRTNHRELHRSPGTGLPTSRTHKSFALHSYEKRACKPSGIRSYAIVGLKVPWNEYLQKKGGGWRPVRLAQIRHGIRFAADWGYDSANSPRRLVPVRSSGVRRAIQFHKLREVHVRPKLFFNGGHIATQLLALALSSLSFASRDYQG